MQEATVRFEARLHAAAAMYVQGLHTLPAGSEAAQGAAAASTGALEDEVMEVEAAHAVLPLDMPAAQVDTPQHDSVLDVNLERLGSLGSSLCSYTALTTLHARSNQLTSIAGETTVPSRLCKALPHHIGQQCALDVQASLKHSNCLTCRASTSQYPGVPAPGRHWLHQIGQ